MSERRKAKLNIPLIVGLVVLCLTLISAHFTGGMYARYITKSSSSDSARVARFDVGSLVNGNSVELANINLENFKPGDDIKYDISLNNSSEVAVEYIIRCETTGNLPIIYPEITGVMAPNGTEDLVEYIIMWEETNNDLSYMGKIDKVSLIIEILQVD